MADDTALTESTRLPVSLVIILGGAIVAVTAFAVTISARTDANTHRIEQGYLDQKDVERLMREQADRLARIEGKLDAVLEKRR